MNNNLVNKQTMAKNIQYYMDLRGVSRKELCDVLNFKYSTVSEWLQAKKYPRIDKIEMMANYFGIEKSDLVEEPIIIDGKRLHSPTRIAFPGGDDVLDISGLTDEQKKIINDMIRVFKEGK